MSEPRKATRWLETAVRHRALALLRRCWKPILLALLITTLLDVAALGVSWAGVSAADCAIADMPLAAEPGSLEEMLAYFNDLNAAKAAALDAFRPYRIVRVILKLINNLLVSPIVLVGLYSGLLTAQRGGACSLRSLAKGLPCWGRVLWLGFLTSLITGVIRYAGNAMTTTLGDTMNMFGIILGTIVWLIVQIFVEMRLCLAKVALGDGLIDPAAPTTAGQCIRASWDAVRQYSIFAMLVTLWPVLLVAGIASLVHSWLPASPWWDAALLALEFGAMAVYVCCTVCIYEEANSPQEQDGSEEGRARAKALAAGEEDVTNL